MAIKQWSVKFRDARDQVIHVQVVTCHHAHNAPKLAIKLMDGPDQTLVGMVHNHTMSIEVTPVQSEASV